MKEGRERARERWERDEGTMGEGRGNDANRRRKAHVTPSNMQFCADELILLEFVS